MFFEQLTETRRQGVTAVETTADRTIYYFHDGDGFRTEEEPFKPFILLSSPEQLSQFEGAFSPTPLAGDMTFKLMASFPDVKTYEAAQKYLKKTPNGPWTFFRDLSQQALLEGKSRLFSGMEFSELRRLSFDLETLTTPGYDFPNSDREGDEIVIISMRDSTGFELVLSQEDMSEKELIQAFVKTLAERDPDVIEGHNLCRFDLPYLEARARRHKVKLALGRDGSTFSKRSSRFNIADRIINYSRYDVWGRHVVVPSIWRCSTTVRTATSNPTTSNIWRSTSESPPTSEPMSTARRSPNCGIPTAPRCSPMRSTTCARPRR